MLYRLPPLAEVYQPRKLWPVFTGVWLGAVAVLPDVTEVVTAALPFTVPPLVPASQVTVTDMLWEHTSHRPSPLPSLWLP